MSDDAGLNRINRQSTTDAIETAQEMSRTSYAQEEAMDREEQRQMEAALTESRKRSNTSNWKEPVDEQAAALSAILNFEECAPGTSLMLPSDFECPSGGQSSEDEIYFEVNQSC